MQLRTVLLVMSIAFLSTTHNTWGQSVGINTGENAINPSAIMEINADFNGTKKGLLPPRVALKHKKDTETIPNPAEGLIVYNTTTSGNFITGKVYADNYYYWVKHEWLGGYWQRMVYTPLVKEAVIPRVYYIEGKDRQEFTTEMISPTPSPGTGQSDVTGPDVEVKFLDLPIVHRKEILTKQGDNVQFKINVSGMYDLTGFVNYNPMATIEKDPDGESGPVYFGKRALLNLKIQKKENGRWRDIVGARSAWGREAAGFLKTITVTSTSVVLEQGDFIRLVIQSPYVSSSHGGGGKPYIGTSDVLPISKGFRAVLLDFDL